MWRAKAAVVLVLIFLGAALSDTVLAASGRSGGARGGSSWHGGGARQGGATWNGSRSWHGSSAWHGARSWHGGHYGGSSWRFGLFLGLPLFSYYAAPYYSPYYYYPPPASYYYDYAPTLSADSYPPAYAESGAVEAAPVPAPSNAWYYYCADTKSYYPFVKDCASEWARVPAQPPPQ